MRVELLFWPGCPSYPEARELLASVIDELGVDATVVEREIATQEEAERLAFPGSPTIRVDGRDVDLDGAQGRAMLACRIYHLSDGRPSPVPTREILEAALR
jgi:hypothetical protein